MSLFKRKKGNFFFKAGLSFLLILALVSSSSLKFSLAQVNKEDLSFWNKFSLKVYCFFNSGINTCKPSNLGSVSSQTNLNVNNLAESKSQTDNSSETLSSSSVNNFQTQLNDLKSQVNNFISTKYKGFIYMKGEKGEKGDTGPQGPVGLISKNLLTNENTNTSNNNWSSVWAPTTQYQYVPVASGGGDVGPQGLTGPQGPIGAQGLAGKDGAYLSQIEGNSTSTTYYIYNPNTNSTTSTTLLINAVQIDDSTSSLITTYSSNKIENLISNLPGGSGISLTDLSATAPLFYNSTTGVFRIEEASSTANGYLSSVDWNIFNNKENALGFTPENVANKTTDLTTPDNIKYPTTLAVSTGLGLKQDTITGGASSITTANLTLNRALLSDASGKVAVSNVTNTELGYLSGVTSAIQPQLNNKQATLVSGTNIKTINGTSVLGSGDIVVSAGASTLDNLTDVIITSASSGEVLKFDGTNWVNSLATGASQWTTTGSDIYFTGGNVGVGTTTPQFKLDIAGDINLTGKLRVGSNQMLYLPDQALFSGTMYLGNGGGSLAHTTGAEGQANTFVGLWAGFSNTTGSNNTGAGYNALTSNTTGEDNTGIGYGALSSNTTGGDNLSVGVLSLGANTTGGANTAIGNYALSANLTGISNTANGYTALQSNTVGSQNIAIGDSALRYNTTGNNNIVSGGSALVSNTTGSWNTVSGFQAGNGVAASSDVSGNSLFGYQAGFALLTGANYNTLLGYQAGNTITTGANNIMIGKGINPATSTDSNKLNIGNVIYGDLVTGKVGLGTTTPQYKLDVAGDINFTGKLRINGTQALYIPSQANLDGNLILGDGGGSLAYTTGNEGGFNTFVGIGAGYSNTTGFSNNAIGWYSLYSNTTGNNNVANGLTALSANTTGSYNVANGAQALYNNTTGSSNTANGGFSLLSNTIGDGNTATGYSTLNLNTTGSYNTANGNAALSSNTTGSGNVANGVYALSSNTTGYNNVVNGGDALRYSTIGSENTVSGYGAGYGVATSSDISGNALFGYQAGYGLLTGANYNTLLGYQAGNTITTGANNIMIGKGINPATSTDSNKLNIGNTIYGDLVTGKVGIGTSTSSEALSVVGNGLFTGKLGLGTSTPTYKLDVVGDINISAGNAYKYNGANVIIASTTLNNYFLGNSGNLTMTGSENLALGSLSLIANTTGSSNVALGYGTLYANTTGSNNLALGYAALIANLGGSNNVALGQASLYNNLTGNNNTANGMFALNGNLSGNDNTATGYHALNNNTTGSSNVALGEYALYSNTTGSNNLALGTNAGFDVDNATSTGNNTFLGYNTGRGIVTGTGNTILGANVTGLASGLSNNIILADGSGNQRINVDSNGRVGIGTSTPSGALTLGSGQILIPDGSLGAPTFSFTGDPTTGFYRNSTGEVEFSQGGLFSFRASSTGLISSAFLTGNGTLAKLALKESSNQLQLGNDVGYTSGTALFSGTTQALTILNSGNVGIGTTNPGVKLDVVGDINVAAGSAYKYNGQNIILASTTLNNYFFGNAGNLTMTGNNNTASGYAALQSNITGSNNTANGMYALYLNTTGLENTATGYAALYANTIGQGNVASGYAAMINNATGSNNTAQGSAALYSNVTGSENTVNGYQAGFGVGTSSNISGNSLFGYQAGYGLLTGADYNTLLGYQAGNTITTGANNIMIGNAVNPATSTDNNKLNIGNILTGDLTSGNLAITGTLKIGAYTLPATDGTLNQVLRTNGSGVVAWNTPFISYASSSYIGISSGPNINGTSGGISGAIFLGDNAGQNASSSSLFSNFLGVNAGANSNGANNSNFIGNGAGASASLADYSNFFGASTGEGSSGANNSNFIGHDAGSFSSLSNYSNFFGSGAGNNAMNSYYSNFFGTNAGNNASSSYYSNFLGNNAGSGSINAYSSNFFGVNAGINSNGAHDSNFFGASAGDSAHDSWASNFLGVNAGQNAYNSSGANFIGYFAGNEAHDSDHSNFLAWAGQFADNSPFSNFVGYLAGYYASSSDHSNFIGENAGAYANNSSFSSFIGSTAGQYANNADGSNFFGFQAGANASSSQYSNFIGYNAGQNLANSNFSNLLGFQAGKSFAGNNLGSNNIIIGTNISLPDGTANAINLGGVLFGTGTYANTTGNPTISVAVAGKIGIGTSTPQYKLDVETATSGVVAHFVNTTGYCDINPTTTSLVCSSDITLKKNITHLEDGTPFVLATIPNITASTTVLEKLAHLSPVQYNWNGETDSTNKHTGFIAQDIEQLFSDLVSTDMNGKKAVNYAGLTPYLVAGLQEQMRLLNGNQALLKQGLDNTATDTLNNLISNHDNINVLEAIQNRLNSGYQVLTDFVALRVTAVKGYFEEIFAKRVQTDKLCFGDNSSDCFNKADLQKIKDILNSQPNSGSGNFNTSSSEQVDNVETKATSTKANASTSDTVTSSSASTSIDTKEDNTIDMTNSTTIATGTNLTLGGEDPTEPEVIATPTKPIENPPASENNSSSTEIVN